jgi:hemoglobin-like flavoprotein
VVEHLEDAPWLESQLTTLGAKHVAYGCGRTTCTGVVGESLLAALAAAAATPGRRGSRKAWSDAYGAISGIMLAGAAGARAARVA